MERRKAIKNLGLTFGAFVAAPSALSILQSCGPTMEPWTPSYFNNEQGVMLRRIVDAMLPSVDDLPSGTSANVHVFIDTYMDQVMPIEDRESMKSSLATLSKNILSVTDEENHEDVSDEAMTQFLEDNLRKTKEEQEAIDETTWEHYEAGKKSDELPEELQVNSVLNSIRGMAIWGYKKDENVCKNALAYLPVPAKWEPCIDLQEASGGRAWAEG